MKKRFFGVPKYRTQNRIKSFYYWNTSNFLIMPVLVSQLEVYYKLDRFLFCSYCLTIKQLYVVLQFSKHSVESREIPSHIYVAYLQCHNLTTPNFKQNILIFNNYFSCGSVMRQKNIKVTWILNLNQKWIISRASLRNKDFRVNSFNQKVS